MAYVDGFVIAVPRSKMKAYEKMARQGKEMWMKLGALDYKECIGQDLKNKWGTSFTRMMKLKPGETVVFSYIVFKSRAHRDSVNAKVMKDPRLAASMDESKMPFDCKRMVYGGFKVLVDA